ncbi:MAG: methyltransferase domain-containing protein [Chloroflexi bacterium]|nr:methyltransferase domain-containing protein [Chloroflexota bacterium]
MNTNRWNRIRYTFYAPIYDWIVQSFNTSRKRSIQLLQLKTGERVLFVGAGTGEDLQFVPEGVEITAVDITPTMVEHIRRKAELLKRPVQVSVMDGQALELPSESFDAVVLHLILAVIPDPIACIQESARVLKPDGRIVVFDKFLPENEQPSLLRRIANVIAHFAFSDINRKLESIVVTAPLNLLHEEPAVYGRFGYKIALYQKS